MFLDTDGWPPAPDGAGPEPRRGRVIDARGERMIMRMIGLFLLSIVFAPLAGCSVLVAVIALGRAMFAMVAR